MRTLINNGRDTESSVRGAYNCIWFADNFIRRIGKKKSCMASRGPNERLTAQDGPITMESCKYKKYTSYWMTETFIKAWIATENTSSKHESDGLKLKIEQALFRKSHLTHCMHRYYWPWPGDRSRNVSLLLAILCNLEGKHGKLVDENQ